MNVGAGSGPGSKPGERLRAERERRGFSTQKVAEDLHIDVWIVEALESGRHASLGAPVFVKGHLRKYAALLGLDADELVLAFGEQADPPLVRLMPKARTRPRRRVPVKAILIVLTVLVVLVAAVVGYRYWRDRAPAASTAGAQSQPVSAGESVVAALTETAPAGRSGASMAPESSDKSATSTLAATRTTKPGAKPGRSATTRTGSGATTPGPPDAQRAPARPTVRVRLSFSADSWVELYDGNQKRVYFDMGVANSARGFTVAAPARVFLGYADGVQLEIDGRPVMVDARVRRDNVAHFTIDARGRLTPAGTLSQR